MNQFRTVCLIGFNTIDFDHSTKVDNGSSVVAGGGVWKNKWMGWGVGVEH